MSSPPPAEWSPHRAMWLGFPSHGELWKDELDPARDEVAALARTLAGPGGERVRLLTRGSTAAEAADKRVGGADGIEIVPAEFGDIWLRDTGPIFTAPGRAAAFRFNGWGGKYRLNGDETVADEIAAAAGARLDRHDFVLEGGALDHDGAGTVLSTRQCLLNPNRNRHWRREADAEMALAKSLGARKVLWLDQGLMNDHT
ncbi:MAG: agmatine deiminase family protein, partial [Caulobacteraceae bacterium]